MEEAKRRQKITRVPCVPACELPLAKKDFRESMQWKIFRIMAEFVDGFQFLKDLKKTVTFFGSARFAPNNPYYKEARKLAGLLAKEKFTVITGGGPGIMEAANRGAYESDGESVGINIELPQGQRMNNYLKRSIGFHYFFTRKVILSFTSQAYVFFPGGFGTLDEFFEMITLIQTKKIPATIPVIVVGKAYWQKLFDWIDNELHQKNSAIDEDHMKIYQLVDSAEEAFEIIKKSSPRKDR